MENPEVQRALERCALETTEDTQLARKYAVTGYPTFVALTSSGPVKKVGYQSASQLVEWLSSLK